MATQFKEKTISSNEHDFVIQALNDSIRTDGRGLNNSRRTAVTFEENWGVARVTIGNTQVICTVSSEVIEPSQSHGNEGLLSFNVQFPPIASPYFQATAKSPQAVEISRVIERCIKDTQCVDTETLCIVAKERVWKIQLDIRVMNYDGNVIDACTLAALAALMYYRRPEITVTQSGITIHNELEKNFIPLRLGFMPITTTFALFDHPTATSKDPYSVVDPSLTEDLTADGMMTIACTPDQEVLCVSATGSNGYESSLVLTNSIIAVERAQNLYQHLKSQLDAVLKTKSHQIWSEEKK